MERHPADVHGEAVGRDVRGGCCGPAGRGCPVLLLRGPGPSGAVGGPLPPAGDRSLKQLGQGVDVNLRHLQSLVLGQLLVVVERRDDAPQLVERVVQPVHAPPLARVRGHAPLLLDPVDWLRGRSSLPGGRVGLGSDRGAFEPAQIPDLERGRGGALGRFPITGRTGMRLGVWRAVIWGGKKDNIVMKLTRSDLKSCIFFTPPRRRHNNKTQN